MKFERLWLAGRRQRELGHRLRCVALRRVMRVLYQCDVPFDAEVKGVHFCHNAFGVVINPTARIGAGTVIQHSVTIGEVDESHASPVIGGVFH